MGSDRSLGQRLKDVLPIVVVLGLSLLLLVYVGFGEAHRTYPKIEFDKHAAQGEIVKNSVETLLIAGLPLKQFVGFPSLSAPILESDSSITEIRIVDEKDRTLFLNAPGGAPQTIQQVGDGDFRPSKLSPAVPKGAAARYDVQENASSYRVVLPLRNKFEQVGKLEVTTPKLVIDEAIASRFTAVGVALVVTLLGYLVFLVVTEPRWGGKAALWLEVSYGAAFLLMAIVVTFAMVGIYSGGLEEKTSSLARSLGQRLNAATMLGLDVGDFEGLDRTFARYRELNPDISMIALTANDRYVIHTTPSQVGKAHQADAGLYEFFVDLESPGGHKERVGVGISKGVVFTQLWRSSKNFLVLFIASAFLAALFLNLLATLREKERSKEEAQSDYRLSLIKPLYFLGCFMEGLNLSFLPQYFQKIAVASGFAVGVASALFTIFFAVYVLSLLPSGRYAERKGVKNLLFFGILLSATGQFLLAAAGSFQSLVLIRVLAGVGQGILFIGAQSYILKVATEEKKTQGNAIIVSGYNGGVFSGTVIGALLVVYMGPVGVFCVAGAVGLMALWYIAAVIPEVGGATKAVEEEGLSESFWKNLGRVFQDFEFVKTTLLVGISTKAVLTGITIFALPLLLARQKYAQEDIGQILMFYALGVLVSSQYISVLADRVGKTRNFLFYGMLGSGVGLILIGMMGWTAIVSGDSALIQTLVPILGLTILGLSHGFIHAPVVTYVADSQSAALLGKSSAASIYRLLERFGHILGPGLISFLLVLNNQSTLTISWIGVTTIVFGILFMIGGTPSVRKEAAHA